ncbi:adenosylcobinamide-GDP ribazoletransferase [Roseovarius sp. A21]|uniref:Adenosylcobinamide-GDP ribazoletransferase n=1 Tax=Roseovarius bejariae TaxID=2576383 RepID=A0A844D4N9_9RHOB|nr:adenosylcobinamide-GDP ribazoletransferase [Roseovarius bejariae]MRU16813.1 adenosylcobinamide-GDP ribazoletransferase [Roseovarius bejariae]
MKNDQALVKASDFPLALALLTRLPVHVSSFERGAKAAWAYPLVGLVTGGLAGLAGLGGLWMGLAAPLSALISMAILTITTGAMHEDGLADTADGLWGGWDRARRLEIMKDSYIGTYGVLALFLSFSGRWAAIWMVFEASPATALTALLAAPMLSRATMPALMAALPHARDHGLSHSTGRPTAATAALGIAITLIPGLFLLGWHLFGAVIWAVLMTLAMGRIARAKIGGQTGDILGAVQQVTEIALLFYLSM